MRKWNFYGNNKNSCNNDCSPEPDCICPPGPMGPQGPRGIPGPQGIQGEVGPAGNAASLTITPLAGGTRPVSAHLVITQIA